MFSQLQLYIHSYHYYWAKVYYIWFLNEEAKEKNDEEYEE